MPRPLSPHSLRGDARFDLEGMFELMGDRVAMCDAVDEQLEHMVAHIKRRTAHLRRGYAGMNRLRRQAIQALHDADEREDDFTQSGLAVV